MPRIPKFNQFPFYLTQKDLQYGCIPTNVAAVLQSYIGQPWVSEQDVIRWYLGTICFETLTGERPPEKLLASGAVQRGLDKWPASDFFELHLVNVKDGSFEDWWKQIGSWIKNNGWPTLFSYKRSDGSIHICTAVGFEGDTLETYDPSPLEQRRAIPMAKSDLESWWETKLPHLNRDIMAIEFKQDIWNQRSHT
jgi:hypothetical protein